VWAAAAAMWWRLENASVDLSLAVSMTRWTNVKEIEAKDDRENTKRP